MAGSKRCSAFSAVQLAAVRAVMFLGTFAWLCPSSLVWPSVVVAQGVPAGDPLRVALVWQPTVPAECPQSATLVEEASRLLGRRIFVQASDAEVTIRAEARPAEDGGWSAEVALVTPDGQTLGRRILRSQDPSCAAVAAPLGLVVALMADLWKKTRAVVHAEAAVRGQERWIVTVGGSALSFYALLPGVAFGAEAQLRLDTGVLPSLEVGVWGIPGQVTTTSGSVEARFWMVSGWARICPTWGVSNDLAFSGCLGGFVGGVHARGQGLDVERRRFRAEAGGLVAGRIEWTSSWQWGLHASAGFLFPSRRDRFFFETAGGVEHDLHRAALVVPYASFGLTRRFP